MDFFDHSHYVTGKNFTRLIGRWPYQGRWESRIYSFIIIFLCISQFIAEVLGVIVYFDNKETVLESITPFMMDVLVTSKYINAIVNVETMIKLLNRLKGNWLIFTNEKEKYILNEYSHIGQFITYGYIVGIYSTTAVFITEPLIPKWINFILQSNETIPDKYPVPIYWYIIDMKENFYPILCYESICIVAIVTITVASDSMFIIFSQHACALFAIVGRQLEDLPNKEYLEENWIDSAIFRKTNDIQYDYYVMCINNHKRAIEFAKLLEDMYVWCFGVVIAINMPIMSVTAVQIATQSNTIQQTIKYIMFAGAQIMHLFFDCYLSQRLTDFSSAIEEHIIHSNWYKTTLETQKLVILVTLRSQQACKLTAGKFVTLSMETFSVIIKTAASYFTVLVSMR